MDRGRGWGWGGEGAGGGGYYPLISRKFVNATITMVDFYTGPLRMLGGLPLKFDPRVMYGRRGGKNKHEGLIMEITSHFTLWHVALTPFS
jgi:hypothetical protein